MLLSRNFEIFVRAIFCLVASVLALRFWMLAVRRGGSSLGKKWSPRVWKSRPRWLHSTFAFRVLAFGCIVFGLTTAMATRHWIRNTKGARNQKTLTLDIHIPNVAPDRTYTVSAKFGVGGRPYVTRSPLHIKFGAQRPVYHATLYYDPKNPTRNAWTRLQPPGRSAINRILLSATGSMVFAILLLEWWEAYGVKPTEDDDIAQRSSTALPVDK